jgi:hypothetical protein
MIKPTCAQTIPKPHTPEFTLKYIDNSYDTPISYSIDPYTGTNITNPSVHIDNRTIEVKIKNQPFTPYYDANSSFNIFLLFNIRIKGHYGEYWTNLYLNDDSHPSQDQDGDYTILPLALGDNSNTPLRWIPSNSTIDFQIQAMIGYFHRVVQGSGAPWIFTGETSDWSATQTVTIEQNSSPTPTPTVPEFPSATIVTIMLIALALTISVFQRKKK